MKNVCVSTDSLNSNFTLISPRLYCTVPVPLQNKPGVLYTVTGCRKACPGPLRSSRAGTESDLVCEYCCEHQGWSLKRVLQIDQVTKNFCSCWRSSGLTVGMSLHRGNFQHHFPCSVSKSSRMMSHLSIKKKKTETVTLFPSPNRQLFLKRHLSNLHFFFILSFVSTPDLPFLISRSDVRPRGEPRLHDTNFCIYWSLLLGLSELLGSSSQTTVSPLRQTVSSDLKVVLYL